MGEIRFDGKTVIVTGAGAGIGRAYALEFAKRGAKVVVNDLGGSRDGTGQNKAAADTVVDEIKKAGGTAVPCYDSVSTPEGGENIVKTAVNAFGRVDVLINNAGILRDKTFVKMTPEEWDAVVSVHLRGAFCVTRPAVAIMREQNYGRIILTTSVSGVFGNFGQSNYGAAKMGLLGFMNVLKLETAKYNIHVNAVAPNAVSRMTEDVFPPEIAKKMQPKFNVPMVVYLSSEECAENGSVFVMGAGWYGKAAIVCGSGACLGDAIRDIPAEEVRDNFAKISNLNGAKPLASSAEVFQFMGPLLS
jgi:NAD(P)-dependent dehydrogenase (short-subunit alcohol dehydrogenase family)